MSIFYIYIINKKLYKETYTINIVQLIECPKFNFLDLT